MKKEIGGRVHQLVGCIRLVNFGSLFMSTNKKGIKNKFLYSLLMRLAGCRISPRAPGTRHLLGGRGAARAQRAGCLPGFARPRQCLRSVRRRQIPSVSGGSACASLLFLAPRPLRFVLSCYLGSAFALCWRLVGFEAAVLFDSFACAASPLLWWFEAAALASSCVWTVLRFVPAWLQAARY